MTPELLKMSENTDGIHELLRSARPSPPLPPGFRDAVWRRIDRLAATDEPPPARWLLVLASRLLHPRWALGGLACALVLGASLGFSEGRRIARDTAQARYVAAVAPETIR